MNYQQQALDFLKLNNIKFSIRAGSEKSAPWNDGESGNHYRVTLSQYGGQRISFSFWGSINDRNEGKTPTAYDVLACISSDVNCPETFADFCGDYGYDQDSRKAYAQFKRCAAFGKKLRGFFTTHQIEQLQEIQ